MLAERWREVKQILSKALELEPSERSAFVVKACSGDAALLKEVESLVAAYGQRESFLESPAVSQAVSEVKISPGAQLGVYQVEELIGAGGMGEVYRAIDTTLGLAVAIKVLPPLSFPDPMRLWRFEQEARAAAILHHPNVLYVHQLGTYEGQPYIVSELLEGQTLRASIKKGPLPTAEILDYALQIAEGLTAAHEKGIIHRDLKPENLFLTKFGQIKILDFGLAKAVESIEWPAASQAVNAGQHHTEAGVLMGTTSYMSPEQLRGEEVGAPSDIFSFGIVLYEMVTGVLPFQGDTAAVISDAILNHTPVEPHVANPHVVNPDASRELERIIERALKKERGERFQHASEMRDELRKLKLVSGPVMLDSAARRAGMPFYQALSRRWVLVGLIVAVLFSVPMVLLLRHRRPATLTTGKHTVVLADFSNATGESIFDDALKQGLEVDLQQSTFLNILPDGKIRSQLQYMGRSPNERLTPDLAREVCRREGAQAALFSSIANLGTDYVLTLKAVDCQGTDLLDEEQGEADRRENVLAQLHNLGSRLRNKLGESLDSVQKYDTPLQKATTSNLEALQALSLAARAFRTQGEAASLPLYKRAIELDPNFALAYADLGAVYSNLNEDQLSAECAKKAYELRDRVTERERFWIDSTYYRSVTGELDKAAQVDEEWKQTYPQELGPYVRLGLVDSYLGRLEQALNDDQEGLRVAPDSSTVYSDLASDYLDVGKLDEAQNVLDEAHKRQMDESVLTQRYQLAFLRGDEEGMRRMVDEAKGKAGIEDALLASQSDTEAFHGRLISAREFSRKAIESALRAEAKETAATWQADAALREAEFGNTAEAKRDALDALKLAKTREVQIATAIALARIGEVARSQSIASSLEKRFPQDTLMTSYWIPSIRAAMAIQQKQASRALEELQAAAPYELGGGTPPFSSGATLYPVYLRGEGYLLNRQWNLAAAEFQKILAHRTLVWNFPLGILAKLQIARAYTGSGDKARARAAYQELLSSWKDADSSLPACRSAKAELVKLN
jgi:eukaryotic-like serine/threonine-protein kinase